MSSALAALQPPPSGARRPRFRILVNHAPVAGCMDVSVTHSNHYRADTFEARISVTADANTGFTAAWWSSQEDAILVEVQFALLDPTQPEESAAWQSELIGEIDGIEYDADERIIHVSGRDLSRRLIDTKTQESFVNQTSSQIATILAGRHGLSANVQTTTTLVGQYYQIEHDRLSLGSLNRATTEWDMLIWLAELEGFDVWVSGTTLNFQPQVQTNATPFVVAYQPAGQFPYPVAGVARLHMERAMTLAKGVEVKVISWDVRNRCPITKVVGRPGRDTQTYVFVRPNMGPDKILQFANNMLEQITRHERKVSFDMPGELYLTIRNIVRLDGTGTTFDQSYYIDNFTRSMSLYGGFVQRMCLKNHSPLSQAAVI